MKVLIVEDESRVANFLQKGLHEAGYGADVADDAEKAETLMLANEYELILLDWVLPTSSGLELCQKLRRQGHMTPVIMLTARDSTQDIVLALDSGADDYIVKPFSFAELLARLRAHFRRATTSLPSTQLQIDDLVVDLWRHDVRRGEHKIYLSSREFALLEYLLHNEGHIVSKMAISEHVWGITFDTNTNLVEVYINHLRKKLECGTSAPLIHTVRGVGYVMKLL